MAFPCPVGRSSGLFVAEWAEEDVVLTRHAWRRLRERGTTEADVVLAVRIGTREPAQRGLVLHRLDIPFGGVWRGRRYETMQVAAVVAHEPGLLVVVTVYTFFFPPPEPAP
jgi:hypothetical protein